MDVARARASVTSVSVDRSKSAARLDGADEVRDEVGAPLVGGLDVSPGLVDGFVGGDEAVVGAAARASGEAEDEGEDEQDDGSGATHR